MSILLGDNFSYSAQKPLDGRLKYDTLANMKAVADATMYDGCMAYCSGTDKTYQWKSGNTVDPDTGKWREFSGGGGGTDYTAGDGIDITNDVISTKQSQEGDIDEIIDVYPQAGNLVSIVNAFNRGDIYSTDEKMIGQWYDGKPLYQKTLVGTISVDTDKTSKNTTIGNVSEDLDTVVSIDGIREHENKSVFVSLSVSSAITNNSAYVCNLFVNSSTGNLVLEDNRLADDGRTVLATVKYTKTTDVAISIGSETEYSTDEKVVGTWVDGKPIFQKTIQGTMPTVTTNGTPVDGYISLGVNVDYFVEVRGMMDLNNGAYRPLDSVHKGVSTMFYNAVAGVSNSSDSNKNSIRITNNNTTWNGMTIYVTAQYTKTTT